MSTNPVIDYHLLYAIVLIALAVYYAGNTWGLGRRWADLDIVRKNHWLIRRHHNVLIGQSRT